MLPARIARNFSRQRLRNLLVILFACLAVPTAAIVWQAYDQLKWEAWFQYRNQAESLTRSIDAALGERMGTVEARGFSDFRFLAATSTGNVQQRSPLSVYPVARDLPGVVGYFQVDPDGTFSTPLLPDGQADPAAAGLAPEEFVARQQAAAELRRILADNELVSQPVAGRSTGDADEAPQLPASVATSQAEPARASSPPAESREAVLEESAGSAVAEIRSLNFEQQAFDRLGRAAPAAEADFDAEREEGISPTSPAESVSSALQRIDDLRLDDALEKKSEDLKRQQESFVDSPAEIELPAERGRRLEKAASPLPQPSIGAGAIRTFDSEIDPYQFSLLGSGHFVLFRNVWRDGDRYIQGLLLDQEEFADAVIEDAFRNSGLSAMSDLVVGYRDAVIDVLRGGYYNSRIASTGGLDGTMLYRARLSAPFGSLELIYSVNRMPSGPGASVLAWTTTVLALVFVGGFFILYRLGLGQIRLARQQQDFVSAVSHELKTPLTSIRMYGEMLREGWASEDKKRQYYEFIHDESERLTRLISNVLQLAKITRNDPQIDSRPVSVSVLVDQVQSKIASQAERAGFEFVLAMAPDVEKAELELDADCFLQIMINLVDNALKFSKKADRRRIEVGVDRQSDGSVTFRVRDFGPGIPKNQLRKIFKLFYRAESELTRETVGTGIGLAIVQQLTTAMNGSVDVLNRDPGAEFVVCFPAKD